jgi:hypothetical protein
MDFCGIFGLLNNNDAYCCLCNKFCSSSCSNSLGGCCFIMCRDQFNSFVFGFNDWKCVMDFRIV